MTTIQYTASTTPCGNVLPRSTTGASAPAAADLLPSATAPTEQDFGDAMTLMYSLLLRDESAQNRAGVAQIQCDQQTQENALRQQEDALRREAHDRGGRGFFSGIGQLLKDIAVDVAECRFDQLVKDVRVDGDACDNPQFWSELEVGAKIVAAIAAAAVTVCSMGTLGPVVVGVAIALSASGFAVQQTHCFGSSSGWVAAGLALGAAAVACGASLVGSGAAVSSSLLQTGGNVANATSAGATVVGSAAHIAVTGYQADACDAEAQSVRAKQTAALEAQIEQWTLGTLQEQAKAHENAMSTLDGAMQTYQQSGLVAAGTCSKG